MAGGAEGLDRAVRAALSRPIAGLDLRPLVMRKIDSLPSPAERQSRWSPSLRWAVGGSLAAAAAAVVLILSLQPRAPGPVGGPGVREFHPLEVSVPVPNPRPNVGPDTVVAPPEAPLPGPQLVRTGPTAGRVVTLPDGTKLTLDRGTTIRVDGSHVQLESGRLIADVTPQTTEFVIATSQAEAHVLGTSFAVELTREGSTMVMVTEGRVRVDNLHGQVEVPKGYFTLARAAVAPLQPEWVSTRALLSWRKPEADSGNIEVAALEPADVALELDVARRDLILKRAEKLALTKELQALSKAPTRPLHLHATPPTETPDTPPRLGGN